MSGARGSNGLTGNSPFPVATGGQTYRLAPRRRTYLCFEGRAFVWLIPSRFSPFQCDWGLVRNPICRVGFASRLLGASDGHSG